MLNKKELELLKQTGVNDKEVTEKLVNFLRHEFDNVVRVKKEDYDTSINKLVDNKQGSYTFIDNESGDFLFKISLFNKEVDGENIGLSFIALNKQGWLLTQDDIASIDEYTTATLLDENNSAFGINLQEFLIASDGSNYKPFPFYDMPNPELNAQEYFRDKQAPFFLRLGAIGETLLIVENNDNSELWGYAFKGYDSDKKYLSHIVIYIGDPDYTIDDLEINTNEQEYFALLNGANFTGAITAPSIIENMSGYSFEQSTASKVTFNYIYCSVCKNGNKLTFATCLTFTLASDQTEASIVIGKFIIPASISAQLYPVTFLGSLDLLNYEEVLCVARATLATVSTKGYAYKSGTTGIVQMINTAGLSKETEYFLRIEQTFLLSDNLVS